jgi:hypothetical protein
MPQCCQLTISDGHYRRQEVIGNDRFTTKHDSDEAQKGLHVLRDMFEENIQKEGSTRITESMDVIRVLGRQMLLERLRYVEPEDSV